MLSSANPISRQLIAGKYDIDELQVEVPQNTVVPQNTSVYILLCRSLREMVEKLLSTDFFGHQKDKYITG